jgi:hypothetical protein
MNTTSIIIEKISASDRMIILFIKEGQIKGINYLQGMDADVETMSDFISIDAPLTQFVRNQFAKTIWADHYEDMCFVHPSPDYWQIIDTIDDLIWDFVQTTEIRNEISQLESKIKELKSQLSHIQK